jgi:hypothetical protein
MTIITHSLQEGEVMSVRPSVHHHDVIFLKLLNKFGWNLVGLKIRVDTRI